MQAQVPREPFLGALQVAQSVVSGGRADRTSVQDVRLIADKKGLRCLATDYELGVRLRVDGAEVKEPGEAVVPVTRLVGILRESDAATVDLQTDGAHLQIEVPGAHYHVNGAAPEEFPEVPEPDASDGIEIDAAVLRDMIKRTQFAAATERSRYTLNGVRWEGIRGGLRLVATDGRRLALIDHKTGGTGHAKAVPPAIVPLKASAVLEKVLAAAGDGTVTCRVVDNRVVVAAGDTLFSALLLEGQYPEYQGVIREAGDNPAQVDPGALLRAVRQAAPLTDQETRAIQVTFKKGAAIFEAQSAGAGGGSAKVEIDLAYKGPKVKIAFDPAFLSDALRALGGHEASLDVAGPSAAAVLRTEDGYTNVIMPITLADGA
ncbi:MAG: DNA polymerase III subunit beta [Planctomycetota bacterium]|jgi:DNA polymerase-3 subunit beta